MSLIILFGLPGTGKTYVGKIFEKYFDYYFYDGDEDLTLEMKAAIKTKTVFTDQMRDVFFKILISKIQNLLALSEIEGRSRIKNLVVAQAFIKERFRLDLLKKIPETKFVLIETNTGIREKRLNKRVDYPLDLEYARKMEINFEKPKINYLTMVNDGDGEDNIKKQIQQFFLQSLS